LGLSLVQAVAKLHGSALELMDRHPGLCIRLSIPPDEAAVAAPHATPPAVARISIDHKPQFISQ
jgi:hypothetical protein